MDLHIYPNRLGKLTVHQSICIQFMCYDEIRSDIDAIKFARMIKDVNTLVVCMKHIHEIIELYMSLQEEF